MLDRIALPGSVLCCPSWHIWDIVVERVRGISGSTFSLSLVWGTGILVYGIIR